MLYGSDLHRVFHNWWEHAKELYGLGAIRGKATDRSTLYYDPLVAYHHVTEAGGHLLLAHELIGQKPAEARLLYDGAAAFLGWRSVEPIQEAVLDYTTLKGEPSGTIRGLTLAREFGDDAVYARLKAYAEDNYGPAWDTESGEFTWGFGLNEWYPRGQYNASIAVHEAGSVGAFSRLYHEPNLTKFIEPTVYGVDFPDMCLSQAWYDAGRRTLIVSTDAGLPRAAGSATSFRVRNIGRGVRVLVDGRPWEQYAFVDGELEITTTIAEHTFLISH